VQILIAFLLRAEWSLKKVGVALSAVLMFIGPVTARAQSESNPTYIAEEIRSAYVQLGYSVDAPIIWWTADAVRTFRVTDPTTDRVLMVLVYPDSTTAEAERTRVQALESNNTGRLVPGFGLSAWAGNVALVESTGAELSQAYSVEVAMPGTDSGKALQSREAVDADFLSALDRAAII
jgi:hypothetical protein